MYFNDAATAYTVFVVVIDSFVGFPFGFTQHKMRWIRPNLNIIFYVFVSLFTLWFFMCYCIFSPLRVWEWKESSIFQRAGGKNTKRQYVMKTVIENLLLSDYFLNFLWVNGTMSITTANTMANVTWTIRNEWSKKIYEKRDTNIGKKKRPKMPCLLKQGNDYQVLSFQKILKLGKYLMKMPANCMHRCFRTNFKAIEQIELKSTI